MSALVWLDPIISITLREMREYAEVGRAYDISYVPWGLGWADSCVVSSPVTRDTYGRIGDQPECRLTNRSCALSLSPLQMSEME